MRKSELKSKLSELAFDVTQNAATEPPFSGEFFNFFESGVYKCICCGSTLFSSEHKFKSHSGWPSFSSTINKNAIKETRDHSFGMIRVEITCSNCKAHLGHVFDDGPPPTQLRYCVNSVALNFVKND